MSSGPVSAGALRSLFLRSQDDGVLLSVRWSPGRPVPWMVRTGLEDVGEGQSLAEAIAAAERTVWSRRWRGPHWEVGTGEEWAAVSSYMWLCTQRSFGGVQLLRVSVSSSRVIASLHGVEVQRRRDECGAALAPVLVEMLVSLLDG